MKPNKVQEINWNDNSLNTVRLIAAVSVMYFHAVQHLNVSPPSILSWGMNFIYGVPVFFCMSGYLIWYSVERSRNFFEYLAKRFRRIYPELWCAIILEVVVLIILANQPIDWLDLMLFVIAQSTFMQFWTPDSLRFYGCGTPMGRFGQFVY